MNIVKERGMDVNIGISEDHRKDIADALSKVLADTYLLYLKTQNYHWNVQGKYFHSLHKQFEEQYREFAGAIDEIAEGIRALGYRAPGTFEEFNRLTTIEEGVEEPEAMEMVRKLVVANEQVLSTARKALEPANKAGDEATIDILTQRLQVHAKNAWMLRSHLE